MEIPRTMRGAVLLAAKSVEVREVPVPRLLPGEMLVKIQAATTCGTDVKVFRRGGHPRMLQVPTLFGHEMAGTVAALEEEGNGFSPGDAVVISNSAPCLLCAPCRIGRENLCEDLHYLNGAFAEYIRVPERFVQRSVHRIPDGLAYERAALTEPLACVLHGIEACEPFLKSGGRSKEVVVYGAGPIGLLFVAVLAQSGHRVLLADPNPDRLEAGFYVGAKELIQVDPGGGQAEVVRQKTEGKRGAWVAIDATGVPDAWSDSIESVRPGGLVLLFGGCAPGTSIPLDTHRIHYSEIAIKGVYHHRPSTVRRALQLLADDALKIDILLSGEQPIEGVAEALESMIRQEALKVVIRP